MKQLFARNQYTFEGSVDSQLEFNTFEQNKRERGNFDFDATKYFQMFGALVNGSF